MDHRHVDGKPVEDHFQRLVDDAQRQEKAVQHAFLLQKHHPRHGADEQRRPKGQQDQKQEHGCALRRLSRDHQRDRVAQDQANQSDGARDPQRAAEHVAEHALLRRGAHDRAVDIAIQVERGQQIEIGDGSACAAYCDPGPPLLPFGIDGDQRISR